MRLAPSTSATSPSRAAPSSVAQRSRRASALASASISTARPCSKRIRSPVTSEPPTSSGLVAATMPSVRSGSGVVKSSSVGRFGTCWMPFRVVARPPSFAKRELGSRPTVRSVPGPTKRRVSRSSSSRRDAASQISLIRRCHASTGSGSSSRQTCSRSRHSASTAAVGSSSGKTLWAHASVGNGEMVQAMDRSSTVLKISGTLGSRSRAARTGSSPASSPGGTIGLRTILAAASSPRSSMRRPSQGGTQASESSAAVSIRTRFTWGSK